MLSSKNITTLLTTENFRTLKDAKSGWNHSNRINRCTFYFIIKLGT